jgi:hypothetical protein
MEHGILMGRGKNKTRYTFNIEKAADGALDVVVDGSVLTTVKTHTEAVHYAIAHFQPIHGAKVRAAENDSSNVGQTE